MLSITAVHHMREGAVREFLKKANAGWDVVESLVKEGRLVEIPYENKIFYVRKLAGHK